MGGGRLWERLRVYSGEYLFNKSKFYLEKFLISFSEGVRRACRAWAIYMVCLVSARGLTLWPCSLEFGCWTLEDAGAKVILFGI